MTTEVEVVGVLRYMAAAWPRTELDPKTVAVYVMHMLRTRLSADVLLLAAIRLVDTLPFMPTVAEWRAEAERIETERALWLVTANHRLMGHPWPEELQLPAGIWRQIQGLSFEPEVPALEADHGWD